MFKKYPVPSIFVLVKYVQSGCNRNTDFQTVPLLAEVYERVGKCVISVSKKAQKD